jgi:hypothetical protein
MNATEQVIRAGCPPAAFNSLIESGAIFELNLRCKKFLRHSGANHRISTRGRGRLFLIPGKKPILPYLGKADYFISGGS